MMQSVGVTEARSKFGELADQARYRGDTVVLTKSSKPATAIVPFALLEKLQRERKERFSVIDEVQAQNRNLDEMNENELLDFVNAIVHEMRAQS